MLSYNALCFSQPNWSCQFLTQPSSLVAETYTSRLCLTVGYCSYCSNLALQLESNQFTIGSLCTYSPCPFGHLSRDTGFINSACTYIETSSWRDLYTTAVAIPSARETYLNCTYTDVQLFLSTQTWIISQFYRRTLNRVVVECFIIFTAEELQMFRSASCYGYSLLTRSQYLWCFYAQSVILPVIMHPPTIVMPTPFYPTWRFLFRSHRHRFTVAFIYTRACSCYELNVHFVINPQRLVLLD